MTENIIEAVNLTKTYGSFTAVDHIHLAIRKGEIYGLLGPNGAGKSTTILMLLGLTEPTSGTIKVCGIDPTRYPAEVKKKVGYLPEDVGFYDDRTGLENLIYTARLNRIPYAMAEQKARQLMERVGLPDAVNKKTGEYSRGMRQRLGLADVLIKNPEVIILDEPTLGIDPAGVKEFLELIVRLSIEEGVTVLFSSHHLQQVQQVCNRVGLFLEGKLKAEGDIHTLSEKLHTGSSFMVEAGIRPPASQLSSVTDPAASAAWLSGILQNLEGIKDIRVENGIFQIECSRDLTADIARAVVTSGAELTYLNNKEYSLDDIYYRYFDGGENA